ncbi:MAG: protein kinase [Bacteroidetes bacterium]|nr:protein kinase [Bacteroidota bacterium]
MKNEEYVAPKRFYPQPGDRIDKYRLISVLGEGSFGIVYKVQDEGGKVFALKMLKLWEIAYEKERQLLLKRFQREFDIAGIESKYIVKSHACGRIKGNPFIIIEYCEGGSLAACVGQPNRIPDMNKLGFEVLAGLHELHQKGFFHRDIKPHNVLLHADGGVKLSDFGIAGHKNSRLTERNIFGKVEHIFGTWAYIAPEQANNKISFKALDAVADIYSFGVMMFELFTGRYPFPPYKIESEKDLLEYLENAKKGNYVGLELYRNHIYDAWLPIIRKCIEPDYQHKRFKTVADIIRQLGYRPAVPQEAPPAETIGSKPAIQVTYGEELNQLFDLTLLADKKQGSLLTIGRKDPSVINDIEIAEVETRYISRRHAIIEKNGSSKAWVIKDGQFHSDRKEWVPSLNGLYLNGQQVNQDGREIKPGDVITMGDTTLRMIMI